MPMTFVTVGLNRTHLTAGGVSHPDRQKLKPASLLARGGTAEAVPFPNSGPGSGDRNLAWLAGAFQFGFQGFEVGDDHAAAVHLDQALGLQPAEIA